MRIHNYAELRGIVSSNSPSPVPRAAVKYEMIAWTVEAHASSRCPTPPREAGPRKSRAMRAPGAQAGSGPGVSAALVVSRDWGMANREEARVAIWAG